MLRLPMSADDVPKSPRWWITVGLVTLAVMLTQIITSLAVQHTARDEYQQVLQPQGTWVQPGRTVQSNQRIQAISAMIAAADSAGAKLLERASATDAAPAQSEAGGPGVSELAPPLGEALAVAGINTGYGGWITQQVTQYENSVAAVLFDAPYDAALIQELRAKRADPDAWNTLRRAALERAARATGVIAGHRYTFISALEGGLTEVQARGLLDARRLPTLDPVLHSLLLDVEDAFRAE